MKKIISFLLICAFVAAIPVFAALDVGGADEKIYVVLGDSIAAGYGIDGLGIDGVAGTNERAYAGKIANQYGFKLYNFSWCGHTSSDLVKRLHSNVRVNSSGGQRPSDMGNYVAVSDAIASADLITISIGGNDLLDLLNPDQLETATIISIMSGEISPKIQQVYADVETNLRNAVIEISTINPNAIIMVQTVYNPYIYESFFGGYLNGTCINYLIDKLNDIFYKLADELGELHVAETAKALNADKNSFYSIANGGDFHPTVAGHAHIAEVIGALYESLASSTSVSSSKQEITTAIPQSTTAATTAATTELTTAAEQTTVTTTVTTEQTTTAATVAATVSTTDATMTTTAATSATTDQTSVATTANTTVQTTTAVTTTAAATTVTEEATAIQTQEQTTVQSAKEPYPSSSAENTAATTKSDGKAKTSNGCGSAVYSIAALIGAVTLAGTVAFKKRKSK